MGVLASVRRVPGPALLLWQMMTIIVDNSNKMPLLDARTLILDLFAAFDGGPSHARILSTRDLLRAGDLMDLSPTAVRTAITRLKQDGRIRAVDRGRYSQGEGDDPWRRRIDGWREVLSRRRAWDGGWLMAAARPTSVSRASWRGTVRALEVEGFRRTPAGLWLRPDNLEGIASTRHRLLDYGAAPTLTTGRLTALDEASIQDATGLWNRTRIETANAQLLRTLSDSLDRIDGASSGAAAREAILLGRAGVRAIVRDPLLPDGMIDEAGLRALVAVMITYDRVGKAVWSRVLGIAAGEPERPAVS